MPQDVESRPVVLTVDDDPAMLLMLADCLSQAGFEVSEASNAGAAMEHIRRQPPDAVLMDVRMPGMDGFEACACGWWRKESSRVRNLTTCALREATVCKGS